MGGGGGGGLGVVCQNLMIQIYSSKYSFSYKAFSHDFTSAIIGLPKHFMLVFQTSLLKGGLFFSCKNFLLFQ